MGESHIPAALLKKDTPLLSTEPCLTHELKRPVQRAWVQDEYMDYFEEAEAIPPGATRLVPADAPMTTGQTLQAVKALEEAPDGRRMLDWSGQGLDNLPKVPPQFRNARVVCLQDNKLSAFPQELAQLRLMQKLRIDSNSITAVPAYINSFSILRDLKACDNSVSSLSSNIAKCRSLTSLDLQRNQLETLPPAMGACIGLERLWLTNNRIKTLPFTLSHLCNLKSLRVDKNELTEIGFNVARLTNLTQLRLGHNHIRFLPENIGNAPKLDELGIEHNSVLTLPPSIAKLSTLTILKIDDNPLERPPMEIAVRGIKTVNLFLNRLQYAVESWDLDLAKFHLAAIPFPNPAVSADWEISMWCRVKHLSLQNNKLVTLAVEIELMSNLTVLDISNNRLATLPPSLGKLHALQVLDAASNKVQALPGQMKHNVNLQEVLLENNRLATVPPVIEHLVAITELRITSNRLVKIADELGSAHFLTHLELQHNGIKRMPNSLIGLWCLKVLNLSHNALTEVTVNFCKIRPLSNPPTHQQERQNQEKGHELGGLLDPKVRQQRVREALFGGKRPQYRTLPNVPLDEKVYSKPAGGEEYRGWDLVRYAIFGKNGPHLKEKVVEEEHHEEEEEEEEHHEEMEPQEEEFLPRQRTGFVSRFRGMFSFGRRPQVEKPGQAVRAADVVPTASEEPPKEAANASGQTEGAKPEDQQAGEEGEAKPAKKSILASVFGDKTAALIEKITVAGPQPTKKKRLEDDDDRDDYGAYLNALEVLDLSYNEIDTIPLEFGNLSTLTHLKLNHNKIERLPRTLNQMDLLVELNLADNLLVEIPKEVGRLVLLQKADFSRQGTGDLLHTLPKEMEKCINLTELRLTGNNFKTLPDTMLPSDDAPGFTALKVLDVSYNPLRVLDDDLAVCAQLEKLYVHHTLIKKLNTSITYMYRLQEIWVAYTEVVKLDPGISKLPHLRKIVLEHEDQLDDFPSIRRLIKGDVWAFLSPGEGEVAELSALQKEREARLRHAHRQETLARANEDNRRDSQISHKSAASDDPEQLAVTMKGRSSKKSQSKRISFVGALDSTGGKPLVDGYSDSEVQ